MYVAGWNRKLSPEAAAREHIRDLDHADQALRDGLEKAEHQLRDVRTKLQFVGVRAQTRRELADYQDLVHQVAQLRSKIDHATINNQFGHADMLKADLQKVQARLGKLTAADNKQVAGLRTRERTLAAQVEDLWARLSEADAAWDRDNRKRLAVEAENDLRREFEAEEAVDRERRFQEFKEQVA